MAIVNSYVKLPEGISLFDHLWCWLKIKGLSLLTLLIPEVIAQRAIVKSWIYSPWAMRLLNGDGRPYPIYPVFIVAHMIVLLQSLQVKPEKHENMIWTKKRNNNGHLRNKRRDLRCSSYKKFDFWVWGLTRKIGVYPLSIKHGNGKFLYENRS